MPVRVIASRQAHPVDSIVIMTMTHPEKREYNCLNIRSVITEWTHNNETYKYYKSFNLEISSDRAMEKIKAIIGMETVLFLPGFPKLKESRSIIRELCDSSISMVGDIPAVADPVDNCLLAGFEDPDWGILCRNLIAEKSSMFVKLL